MLLWHNKAIQLKDDNIIILSYTQPLAQNPDVYDVIDDNCLSKISNNNLKYMQVRIVELWTVKDFKNQSPYGISFVIL